MDAEADERCGVTDGAQRRMAPVLERNIALLHARFREDERKKGLQSRIADAITRFAGSMLFVYLHLLLYSAWIIINLEWTPVPAFDPTFVVLAMEASVEAIFLSTFVLITQNRMAAQADRRAELDLQISLLTEHEVTRIVQLLSDIAQRVGIDPAAHQDLEEIKQDVRPEQILDRLDQADASDWRVSAAASSDRP